MRVLIVEDEPLMAQAIRDGLRLEAIAADIAGDGDGALELLSVNDYDMAVLDRDVPGPTTRPPGSGSAPTTTSPSRSNSKSSYSGSGRWIAGVDTTGRPCERSPV